ncbi:hypothetical protein BH23CHL4_BH23CHL4_05550 [soil metagenome]
MLLSVLISLLTLGVVIGVIVDRRLRASGGETGTATRLTLPDIPPNHANPQHSIQGLLSGRLHLSRRISLVAFAGSLALVVWGQWQLATAGPGRTTMILWFMGLAGIACLARLATTPRARVRDIRVEQVSRDARAIARIDIVRLALASWSLVASVAVWRLVGPRSSGDHVNDVLVLWISAMISGALAVGGLPSGSSLNRLWTRLIEQRREAIILAAIFIVALVLRVFPYGSYPRSMSGDEGRFAIEALRVLDGSVNNYFAAGTMGFLHFTFASLAAVMSIAGETVGASRLLSGIIGALAILPTYILARKHFGMSTATLAGIILTVSHIALFWSRNTMNNATAFLFVPLTLWLLDAGLIERRRLPALFAGFSVGLSMLFYASNRTLMPIAILYIGYAVIADGPRSRRDLSDAIRGVAPSAALGAAGFAVAAMPMLSHFRHHPGSFNSRINQVSVFASGWLDREVDIRGESVLRILASQFQSAALLPFDHFFDGSIFHPDPPLLGWPLIVPTAIGLTVVTLAFWQRSHFGLAAGYWATIAGMAVTIGPTEPHKLVTALSIISILAAVGVVAIASILLDLIRAPRLLVAALVTAMALFVVLWNANYYFREPDRVADFSDPKSQVAQSLAEAADRLGPGTTVYFLGAPWMTYGGFQNIAFVARDAEGIDIIDPVNASSNPPELDGPTLFAVLGGRASELEIIRGWFPNGVEERYSWSEWGYLYSTYTVYPEMPAKRIPAPS